MSKLIIAGIWITPFFISAQFGNAEGKLWASSVIMFLIFLQPVYEGRRIECRNVWLLAFMVLIPLGYYFAPKLDVMPLVKSPYFWKPAFFMLCHFLGFLGISNWNKYDFESGQPSGDYEKIIKHISWAAFVMALYVIVQYFGADQFFTRKIESPEAGFAVRPWLYGALGNSRICGAYLAVCFPALLGYFFQDGKTFKIWMVFAALMAIAMIQSKLAWFGVLAGTYVYFFGNSRRRLVFGVVLAFLAIIAWYSWHLPDSSRLAEWKAILSVFLSPLSANGKQYCLLGYGAGAFPFFYTLLRKSVWYQAHNEYLEILFNFGVIGIGIFMAALISFLKRLKFEPVFLAILCASLVMAGGLFVWQFGPIVFLTVLSASILSEERKR